MLLWVWSDINNKEFEQSRMTEMYHRIRCLNNMIFFLLLVLKHTEVLLQYKAVCVSPVSFIYPSQTKRAVWTDEIHPCIIFGLFYPQMLAQYLYLMSWTLCQHLISSILDFPFIWPILIESCSSFSMSTSRVDCSEILQGDGKPCKDTQ